MGVCAEAKTAEKGWALNQISKLSGAHSVLMTAHALRVESISNHYIVVARAPSWQMVIYNPSSKVSFRTSVDKFRGRLAMGSSLLNGNFLEDLPLSNRSKTIEPFLSVKSEHYSVLYKHQSRPRRSLSESPFALSTHDVVGANYWVWAESDAPLIVRSILQKIYKVPIIDRIPLRLILVDSEKHASIELDTKKIQARMIDDSVFAVPSGLRPVGSEEEVLNDADRKFRVNRMIQNFDDWRDVMDREGK